MLAIGARLGEMTTGGYTLLDAAAAGAEAGPRARRRRRSSGRVYAGRPAAAVVDGCAAHGARDAGAAADALRWAGVDARRAHADYEANLRADAGRSRSTWREVVQTHRSAACPRDTDLHQRRRQLRRLAAPLLPLPGLQHRGRTQLAPTSGAMGYGVPAAVAAALAAAASARWSTSPATATS